jgi:hypothetical protein
MSGPDDRRRVQVSIDRLVLRGIDPAHQKAFAESLKAELVRALADPATLSAVTGPRRTQVLRLGPATLQPGAAGARSLGATVARGIGKGVKP